MTDVYTQASIEELEQRLDRLEGDLFVSGEGSCDPVFGYARRDDPEINFEIADPGFVFVGRVQSELAASRLRRSNLTSAHEGYAFILEEVDELWKEIKRKSHKRSDQKILDEVIQIAAWCQRFAEDLGLMEEDD